MKEKKLWQKIEKMNALPVEAEFKGPTALIDLGQPEVKYGNQNANQRMRGFSDIVKGGWYFKVGRTSEITTGICNGTEATVKIEEERQDYDQHGQPTRYVHHDTSDNLIILNSPLNGDGRQWEFCRGGDSGSLIIDTYGNCAGIMFGNITGFATKENSWRQDYVMAGQVTTMSAVLDSIRTKAALRRRVVGINQEGREIAELQPGGPDGVLTLGHL